MNCQDIQQILDHRDTTRLDAVTHRGVLAHAQVCIECARDWELHTRFANLPDAKPSSGFAARCRALVASGNAQQLALRPGRRYALIGSLVAVSAAAAMLAVSPWRVATSIDAAVAVEPGLQDEGSTLIPSLAVAAIPPPVSVVAKLSRGDSASPPAAVTRFSVQVMPLQNDARDAAGQATVELFYGAMLEQLRTVVGLRLVMADAADERVGEDAEFKLLIRGTGPDSDNRLTGTVRAMRRGPDGLVQPVAGQFEADCVDSAGPSPACFDASALAKSLVALLQTTMFPTAPDQQQFLLTRLQDEALAPQQRLRALQDLAAPRGVRTGQAQFPIMKPGDLRDPALVRAAIDLAETTVVPAIREEVWRRMRGVGDLQLLRPLISSAQLDAGREARTEAVRTLGADFAALPEVRAALEVIARQDPSPLVRAMARKGLKGEEAWNSYLVESLKDASRPDEERLEALFYQVSWPSARMSYEDSLQPLIDQDAIPALAEVLPRAARSGANRDAISRLISHLGAVHHPAITDLLIERVDASIDVWERRIVIGQLVQRNRDGRVRAALSRVAAEDADPQLREMAEAGLRKPSATEGQN